MKMASRWLYIVVLITTLHSLPLIAAQYIVEPRDAEVLLNGNVTMRCSTDQPGANVFWSVPGGAESFVGTTLPTSLVGRFSIVGQELGEDNLVITNVLPQDSGPYVCIVIIADRGDVITTRFNSGTGTLRVVQVPETGDTVCWTQEGRVAAFGDQVSLRCASSDPTVGLTWFLGDLELSSSPLDISPGTAVETEFLAQAQTNLQTYTCQPNSGDHSPCSVTLEVQHPPVVSIEEDGMIETGLDAKFICRATGNPDNFAFIWHYNDYQIGFEQHSRFNRARLESSGSVLVLPDLGEPDNNVTLRCEAVNALGATTTSHVIIARPGKTLAQIIGPIILGIILGLVLIVLFIYFIWWRRQRIKVEEISKKSKSVKRNDSRRSEVPTVDTGIVYTQTVGGFGNRYGKKSASNGDLARSGLDLESAGYGPDVTNFPAYRATAEEEKEDDGALRPIPRKKSTGSLSSLAAINHPSSSTTADDANLISPKEDKSFTYHVNPHFRFLAIENQPENDFGSDEKKENPSNLNIENEAPDSNVHSGDDENIISTEL